MRKAERAGLGLKLKPTEITFCQFIQEKKAIWISIRVARFANELGLNP